MIKSANYLFLQHIFMAAFLFWLKDASITVDKIRSVTGNSLN